MNRIFECMEAKRTVLASARDRQEAAQMCQEWLGWKAPAVFSAPEMEAMWRAGGGTSKTPVVESLNDGRAWAVVMEPSWKREAREVQANSQADGKWYDFDALHIPPQMENLRVEVEQTMEYDGEQVEAITRETSAYYDAMLNEFHNAWGKINGQVKRWKVDESR